MSVTVEQIELEIQSEIGMFVFITIFALHRNTVGLPWTIKAWNIAMKHIGLLSDTQHVNWSA